MTVTAQLSSMLGDFIKGNSVKPRCLSFWHTLLDYSTHLLPVSITISILVLSFRNVYWTDLGTPYINSVLNSLQFAAKFHELTIAASIASLTLHRLRFELMEMGGVPLGFVTAGYRLGELFFLFSWEFWAGILAHGRGGNRRWLSQRWLPLSLLLPIAILLSSTVGPSLAIVMIPQLNWWDMQNPFAQSTFTTYVNLKDTSDATWPTKITSAFIPKSCAESVTEACPFAGLDSIESWIGDFQNNNILPNFTISNDGQVERYLTSIGDNKQESILGYTVSSTVHSRATRDLGGFWEYVIGTAGTGSLLRNTARPMIIPSSDVGIKKPVVQVQYRYIGVDWSIPTFNLSADTAHMPKFRWVDMQNYTGKPTIGAIFVGWGRNFSDDRSQHPPFIVPCTIDASWASVKMWLDPRVNSVILQDSPDPSELVADQSSIDALEPIAIDIEWAEALNFVQPKTGFTTPAPPGPDGNFSAIERLISGFGYEDAGWVISSEGRTQWCCSTSLGLYLSDALARVQSNITSAMYQQVPSNLAKNTVTVLNNRFGSTKLAWGFNSSEISWEEFTARLGNWTVNYYSIQRYGYGWGFSDVPTILAITILLCHAVLAIMHLTTFTLSSWRCRNWDSVGQMLALALHSKSSEGLKESCVEVDFSTWKTNTKIVVVNEREFEMSVD